MKSDRLASRLQRIRKMEGQGKKHISVTAKHPVQLSGWTEIDDLVYERECTLHVSEYRPYCSPLLPLLFPRERVVLEKIGPLDVSNLLFFDLETTGLSHGAGTVAFMAALASFTAPGELCLRQFVITDFPGEAAFLAQLAKETGKNPCLVSFNGKCFDCQILATRYAMNGIQNPFASPKTIHLDLLFPSRRLFRHRLPSCRLVDIETSLLGIHRPDDLPGSEAPEAWFDFIAGGSSHRLLAVGDHNRDDVFALARLLLYLDSEIEQGNNTAALLRAMDLRRQGYYQEALPFLERCAASGDIRASRLLAIDLEHRLDDLTRALTIAKTLDDPLREKRIRTKIERRKDR